MTRDATNRPTAIGGTGAVAVRAAAAGSDLLLHVSYDASVTAAAAIAGGLRSGRLSRAEAERSVARILALRAGLR